MKIRKLFGMALAFVLIGLMATISSAQEPANQRLAELNEKIGQLLTQMNERAQTYPQVIDELRTHSAGIEKAGEEVQKMLDDLRQVTDQMDVNSDYHKELKVFQNHTSELIAKVKAKDDPNIEKFIGTLETNLEQLQSIDRRRAAAVIQARNIIRSLENHQENLVLIMQIGHIQAAIEIFESSLGEYEGIIRTAQGIQEDVTTAISTP